MEATEVAGHRYGLLRSDLEKELRLHRPVVVEVTAEGGLEVARQYPNSLSFFLTSSEKERRARIRERLEDKDEIDARMREGNEEEKLARAHYPHIITNIDGHPEEAIEQIKAIVCAEYPDLAH